MDRVRPSREDDDFGVEGDDGVERRSTRNAEREDVERANSASDEMGVLRAIVEDKHQIRFQCFWLHGGGGKLCKEGSKLGF